MLSDAVFAVLRNETKFATRNKATRNKITHQVLRAETVRLMDAARHCLERPPPAPATTDAHGHAVYTDRDIPGLGKNYLKEEARKAAVATYAFFARYYALRGVGRKVESWTFARVEAELVQAGAPALPVRPRHAETSEGGEEDEWAYQKHIVAREYPGEPLLALLGTLVAMQETVAKSAMASKARDSKRGDKTTPDYGLVHVPPAEEAVVVDAFAELERVRALAAAHGGSRAQQPASKL